MTILNRQKTGVRDGRPVQAAYSILAQINTLNNAISDVKKNFSRAKTA